MRWSTTAFPGNPAQVWEWTLPNGLVQAPPEEFQPKPGQTWADLDEVADSHPIEVLGFAPVYAQLSTGLDPAAWEDVTRLLDGLGSGKAVAGGYSGAACDKFVCEEEYARLWVDRASETAFVLWHTEGAETNMAYPLPMENWPDWIRDEAAELAD